MKRITNISQLVEDRVYMLRVGVSVVFLKITLASIREVKVINIDSKITYKLYNGVIAYYPTYEVTNLEIARILYGSNLK